MLIHVIKNKPNYKITKTQESLLYYSVCYSLPNMPFESQCTPLLNGCHSSITPFVKDIWLFSLLLYQPERSNLAYSLSRSNPRLYCSYINSTKILYFILHSYIKDVVVRVLYQVSIVCSLRYSFKLLLYQSLTIYLIYLKRINNKEKCKWFFFLNKTKKEGERERERERHLWL